MNNDQQRNVGRDSEWTSIYWGVAAGELRPFVRLTPDYLELERLRFPHGILVSGPFAQEADAHAYAERVDQFMASVALAGETGAEWTAVKRVPAEDTEHFQVRIAPCCAQGKRLGFLQGVPAFPVITQQAEAMKYAGMINVFMKALVQEHDVRSSAQPQGQEPA